MLIARPPAMHRDLSDRMRRQIHHGQICGIIGRRNRRKADRYCVGTAGWNTDGEFIGTGDRKRLSRNTHLSDGNGCQTLIRNRYVTAGHLPNTYVAKIDSSGGDLECTRS